MDEAGGKPKGRWCLVGNVVEERRYGEHGEIRRGTRLFAPGAKVYCLPAVCTSIGGDQLFAIGRHRKSGRFIGTVIRPNLVVEPRAKVAYHPEVLRRIEEEVAAAADKRGVSDPWTDQESVESYIRRMDDWADPRRPVRPTLVLPDPTPAPAFRLPAVVYDNLVAKGAVSPGAPFELVNGALAWIPPRPSEVAACVERARRALEAIFEPVGFHVRVDSPILLSTYDQPRPALAVIRGRRDLYDRVPPGLRVVELVVETAGAGLERSRGADGELFAEVGIPRYWILDPAARAIHVHDERCDGAFVGRKTLRDGEQVALLLNGRDYGSIPVAEMLP